MTVLLPMESIAFCPYQQLFWHQQYKKKCCQMLKKKLNKKVYFLLNFFQKGCQQQQQLNTHFFFQKETTESWFQQQMTKFLFFLFPHLPEKRVPRGKLFWLFFLNENIVRFGVRTKATKKKQEELASPCFFFCPKTALLQERQHSF